MSLERTVGLFACLLAFLSPLIVAEDPMPGEWNGGNENFELNNVFTDRLIRTVSSQNITDNMVYSPFGLQSILAMTYAGATGKTAEILREVLGLPHGSKTWIYKLFGRIMKSLRIPDMDLEMVNKLLFAKNLMIRTSFRNLVKRYFDGEVQRVNFKDREGTAKSVNAWVANKTNNRIQNMLSSDSLQADAKAMLVNSMYLNGEWEKPFTQDDTSCNEFWLNYHNTVPVSMMYQQEMFNFADMSHTFGGRVLQLPYADSDLSLLVLLPNTPHGLPEMQKRLNGYDLREIPKWLHKHYVDVYLPKFRLEYELDVDGITDKLNISYLFNDQNELGGVFGRKQLVPISELKHKVYFDVHEEGSDASSVTGANVNLLRFHMRFDWIRLFRADHPFMFAVVSPEVVYFVGQFVTPNKDCRM